ncbi:MAG TPA: hypothetical protein VI522_03010 [Gammaproteobacteria bacterium]|nr:hypothetical protein [Gammaproteobacteria bacterium]
MSYDNTNKGMIAKNTTATNANAPEYRGSINIEGREFWLSCWVNTGKEGTKLAGQKYFSITAQPKDNQTNSVIQSAAKTADLSSEEDLPF